MNIPIACAPARRTAAPARAASLVLALSLSAAAANLQERDIFFFSTHKSPRQMTGDHRQAYVLTENGVLVYDYNKDAWVDNLYPGQAPTSVSYSRSRSKLFVGVPGRVLEYNFAFRRFTDASPSDLADAGAGGSQADVGGLAMTDNWFFMGDAVRDRHMRKAPVAAARLFDYDHLWILSDGLGPFLGSTRRKQARSVWFGVDQPATVLVHSEGGKVWFGACRPDAALVQAKSDLTDWKVFPAGLEYGFQDGCVRDVEAWKDYVWVAHDKGVARQDPRTGQFRAYAHFGGSANVRVYELHEHQGSLCAGTEEGVSCLAEATDEFRARGQMPGGPGVPTYELESKGKDLWAGTRYGLYVHRADGWKSLKDVSGTDTPEAYGLPIPSVRYHDTTLYWVSGGKIMFKPKREQPMVLFERDRPTRLVVDGDILYALFYSGVTAYNLRRRLWTDFRLEDGIPGRQALSMAVFDGRLWVGTDVGVTRINLRPYLP